MVATLVSRPRIIVITEITAATPTTIPMRVRAVRSLLERKLPAATRNASQRAVRRKSRNRRRFPGAGASAKALDGFVSAGLIARESPSVAQLSDFFVFFDESVANGDYTMRARGNVMLMRYDDDRISFSVQALEEVHDLHAGMRIESSGGLVGEKN